MALEALRRLWAVPGWFWGGPGAVLVRSWDALGQSRAILEWSWGGPEANLGRSWEHLGPFRGNFQQSWGHLGGLFRYLPLFSTVRVACPLGQF